MIFPYAEIERSGQIRLLPLVPISLHGPAGTIDVVALLDSGAEHSVFGDELASHVGIEWETGDPVVIVGVGEHDLPGRLLQVELQLGRHHWTAPTIFCPELKQRAILGQAGFFAYFTVTFRYRRREVVILRAK
jgi:hypothetical protein